jgi:hypothetical protein
MTPISQATVAKSKPKGVKIKNKTWKLLKLLNFHTNLQHQEIVEYAVWDYALKIGLSEDMIQEYVPDGSDIPEKDVTRPAPRLGK